MLGQQKCWHPNFTALKNIRKDTKSKRKKIIFGQSIFEVLGPMPFFNVLFFGALLYLGCKYLRTASRCPKSLCNPDGRWEWCIFSGCPGHLIATTWALFRPFLGNPFPSREVSKTLWPNGKSEKEIKSQMKCWQLGNFHRQVLHCVQLDGRRTAVWLKSVI